MKVLITGGSGFVGREVCRQLEAEGYSYRCLSRHRPNALPQAFWFKGSILDPDALSLSMKGCEAIIHLVGIISESPGQTFERIHIEGTTQVLQAAHRAGIQKILHMSALGARPGAVARYHRSKWEAEVRVQKSGLKATIFRPSIIYGPGDGFVTLFAQLGRWSPFLPVIGDGLKRLQPVAVEDVAACFVAALKCSEAEGQTVDLCGSDSLTFLEVLNAIDKFMGRKRYRLKIPSPIATLQACLLEFLCFTILRCAPPLNRDQILMLAEDNIGDSLRSKRLFGVNLRPFSEGLSRFLKP
ncbi:MAG: complex I NDUFA9 subunit family protein [Pedosphaera sp.]|nr:complex I NDUFA9 subunit family protein [Pedosphaera sp.]